MARYWIAGAASAAILAVTSLTGDASPARNALALRSSAAGSMVEKAAYRRCGWRGGRQHCRWVEGRPRAYGYGYYYGRPRPEELPTGSTAWWRAMDYEGRGGHGRTH
jgi:hypothetical protein